MIPYEMDMKKLQAGDNVQAENYVVDLRHEMDNEKRDVLYAVYRA